MTGAVHDEPPSVVGIEPALGQLAAGHPVVVVDDLNPTGPGYLVWAAELATAETVAFAVRHSSGFLCVAISEREADRLDLPAMSGSAGRTSPALRFAVTVDAAGGTGTGISAHDRAATIRLLGSPTSQPADFTRPGHVVPVRADPRGVLGRAAAAETATDLAALAGLRAPVAALAALVSEAHPTGLASGDELCRFAVEHGLALTSTSAVLAHRRRALSVPVRVAERGLQIAGARFCAISYRHATAQQGPVAFVLGDVSDVTGSGDVLVRVQRECVLGDVFGSTDCGCGDHLQSSLSAVASAGRGVVIYLRDEPGQRSPVGDDSVLAEGILAELAHARRVR